MVPRARAEAGRYPVLTGRCIAAADDRNRAAGGRSAADIGRSAADVAEVPLTLAEVVMEDGTLAESRHWFGLWQ